MDLTSSGTTREHEPNEEVSRSVASMPRPGEYARPVAEHSGHSGQRWHDPYRAFTQPTERAFRSPAGRLTPGGFLANTFREHWAIVRQPAQFIPRRTCYVSFQLGATLGESLHGGIARGLVTEDGTFAIPLSGYRPHPRRSRRPSSHPHDPADDFSVHPNDVVVLRAYRGRAALGGATK
jgi:hypothetical protein